MAKVGLRDIVSPGDRAAVMGLRRGPGQDQYLNSMEEIFAEAGEEQRAMPHPWAVHDAETGALAGFAMISDNIPQPIDDDLVGPYFLWKLLIDHQFQRRGYGAATLDAVVDYLADAARRRRALHQLRRRPRLAARVLPPLRLHRHRPGHVGRERPRARPRAARLTGGSLDHLHRREHAQITHICAPQLLSMKGPLATQAGLRAFSLICRIAQCDVFYRGGPMPHHRARRGGYDGAAGFSLRWPASAVRRRQALTGLPGPGG